MKRSLEVENSLENAMTSPRLADEVAAKDPESKNLLSDQFPPLSDFRIRWNVLITLVVLHIGAVASLWFITWSNLAIAFALYFLTMLGLTTGYHRLLAHRSFEAHPIIKWFHVGWASISLQMGPITWARMHRIHHAKSDSALDPHPQIYSFWFGHFGWIILAHKRLGRSSLLKKMPADMADDKFLLFLEKYNLHLFWASMLVLFLIGGLPLLLVAGCLRVVVTSHFVWSVNSICHRFGYRRFDSRDLSTNNAFVALITFGEGWHNNHHRFPSSARHGLFPWEFDITWIWLNILAKLKLVKSLKTPKVYAPEPEGPLPVPKF